MNTGVMISNMVDTWSLVFLLTCYIEVSTGSRCMKTNGGNSTTYIYCYSGCCGQERSRYCCSRFQTGTVTGIVISVVGFALTMAFLLFLFKKCTSFRSAVQPHDNVQRSNRRKPDQSTSAFRGGPPVPPPYTAHDPPPPYSESGPGPSDGSREINTSGLQTGSDHNSSSMSQSAWLAPDPRVPHGDEAPPRTQPLPPPRMISSPPPAYTELPGAPANSDNTIHPPR